jgi:6-phospho-3-hexuloisomerase
MGGILEMSMGFKYIEQIKENVLRVSERSLGMLYDVLEEADCIIPYGSGRSYSSIKISMSQLAKIFYEKTIMTPEDQGFPGNNMYEAAGKLEKRFRRIVLLLNSGSGSSQEPLTAAKDFAKFISENNSDKFVIVSITSDPASPIGVIADRYGFVVELKGRTKEVETIDYMTSGIMGDTFELGSLLLTQGVVKALFKRMKSEIKRIHREYFRNIDTFIREHVASEIYDSLVDELTKRTNVFVGGRGSADEVAEMTVIRLSHVKYALGDHVYKARGANTPRPRPGDIGILISFSGETPTVVRWAKTLREEGCIVYSFVGRSDSSLARSSSYYIPIEAPNEDGPRDFYMYAAFVLSPLPIKLIGKLSSSGLTLPEKLLRYYHSTVE